MIRSRLLVFGCGLAAGFGLLLGPARSADNPAPGGWGTVKGQAVWVGGAAPAPKKLDTSKEPQCEAAAKGPLFSEELVVNKKNNGVRWAFVWLAPDPAGGQKSLPIHPALKEIKAKRVEMDQPCCQFVPHVLGMRQGQEIAFKNSAAVAHNVNYAGGVKNPSDNKLVPPGGALVVADFKASPRPVKVACNIHGWMGAWVFVLDHPYFAVTDEDGKFEIKNAPAGNYRLIGWHEQTGWLNGGKEGTPVAIKPDGTVEVKVEVK